MKICSKKDCDLAGQLQSLDNFSKDNSCKDKLRPQCRKCTKKCRETHEKERKQYRLDHVREKAEYDRQYNETHKEQKKEQYNKYYNSIGGRFRAYQSKSKRRNIVFNIDFEFASILFLSDCFYCGEKPNPLNGIDRKNNELGYIKDNCVACCSTCNFLKKEHNFDFFVQRIKKIYKCLDKQGVLI